MPSSTICRVWPRGILQQLQDDHIPDGRSGAIQRRSVKAHCPTCTSSQREGTGCGYGNRPTASFLAGPRQQRAASQAAVGLDSTLRKLASAPVRIPDEAERVFRSKLNTDSDRSRTPIIPTGNIGRLKLSGACYTWGEVLLLVARELRQTGEAQATRILLIPRPAQHPRAETCAPAPAPRPAEKRTTRLPA